MRYLPLRRRRKPPLPLTPQLVPFAGGLGVEVDFGAVLHELDLEELFKGLAVKWRGITGK